MTSKIGTLSGRYNVTGAKLQSDHATLLVVTRSTKARSKAKTSQYLLQISASGKRTYLSSLYPVSDALTEFEYQGTRYVMKHFENACEIAAKGKSRVYQMDLRTKSVRL